jgi:lysophospholipase L1-like esterase
VDFANYDLVTLFYGINDYKGYADTEIFPLGTFEDDIATGGTFYSNMRYCIEKIIASNPLCKIIVITPINCSIHGTEDGNWCLSYDYKGNGTLEDFFVAIKTICEYYGVEMIDMTHNSIVNRKNIKSVLPDNLHPSIECHKAIAMELSAKINYE